jgi:pyrroline-5-carboxylate reductase
MNTTQDETTIGFIGGGNMASCMIDGLIRSGFEPSRIIASAPSEETLQRLRAMFAIRVTQDNQDVAMQADVLIFAVKPQILLSVASALVSTIQEKQPLVISIAAGIGSDDLNHALGGNVALARIMPNTPSLIGCGAAGLYANTQVSDAQKSLVESIARATGVVVWIDDEKLIDVVAAVSGSGPAYFFMFMECLQKSAETLGLKPDDAKLLVLQTALGASRMALESDESLATLRERVTSPQGTTEAALNVFNQQNMPATIEQALDAAIHRAKELGEQFGKTQE